MLNPLWKLLLLFSATVVIWNPSHPAVEAKDMPGDEVVQVECHGKLRDGIVAAGGETTGCIITFDGMTWELQFSDDDGRQDAKKHHKQPMTVVGSLKKVAGKAIPVRWIVEVQKMTPRDAAAEPERAQVKVNGLLRKHAATTDGPEWLAIEAGEISWPLELTENSPMPGKAQALIGKPAVLEGRLENRSEDRSHPRPVLCVKKMDAPPAATAQK